eukprot:CAMPEP_0114514878 /NCGR_PEP_ID=MMETSP0109-20121206/16404_1 /TAXON_ID=29199 /ORGANISM="Chlorarachnion reptans, Strain CCCM449" /LENGTH=103 /DNA_ID=CAMNT_0001694979 /DNA_START=355 /DNA_END=663 /DNA_ORIENTATION=-
MTTWRLCPVSPQDLESFLPKLIVPFFLGLLQRWPLVRLELPKVGPGDSRRKKTRRYPARYRHRPLPRDGTPQERRGAGEMGEVEGPPEHEVAEGSKGGHSPEG